MSRRRQVVAVALGLIVACGAVDATVYALSASSASYRLVETVAASKGFAQSAGFKAYTSTGQPTRVGIVKGPTYQANIGFVRRAFGEGGQQSVPTLQLLDPDVAGP